MATIVDLFRHGRTAAGEFFRVHGAALLRRFQPFYAAAGEFFQHSLAATGNLLRPLLTPAVDFLRYLSTTGVDLHYVRTYTGEFLQNLAWENRKKVLSWVLAIGIFIFAVWLPIDVVHYEGGEVLLIVSAAYFTVALFVIVLWNQHIFNASIKMKTLLLMSFQTCSTTVLLASSLVSMRMIKVEEIPLVVMIRIHIGILILNIISFGIGRRLNLKFVTGVSTLIFSMLISSTLNCLVVKLPETAKFALYGITMVVGNGMIAMKGWFEYQANQANEGST